MARIRTLKPEFWSHPVMARLDPSAQCLALALLNLSDDEGFFLADPALVRAFAKPFTESSVSVQVDLNTLSKVGWIEVKNHPTHGPVGRVINFDKHQAINRPSRSKIKAYFFTEDSVSIHELLIEDSHQEQGTGNREQGTTPLPPSGDGKRKRAKRGSAASSIMGDPGALKVFQEAWQIHPRRKDSAGNLRSAGNQAAGATQLLERIAEGMRWDEVIPVEREYLNHPNVKSGYAEDFQKFWGPNGHWFGMLQLVRRGVA